MPDPTANDPLALVDAPPQLHQTGIRTCLPEHAVPASLKRTVRQNPGKVRH